MFLYILYVFDSFLNILRLLKKYGSLVSVLTLSESIFLHWLIRVRATSFSTLFMCIPGYMHFVYNAPNKHYENPGIHSL